jgi:hypothetical protein
VNAARAIYKYLVLVVFVGVVVQVGLAGYGAFYAAKKVDDNDAISKHSFEHGWNPHSGFGFILGIIALILFIVALVARFDARFRNLNIALFVLFLLQILVFAPVGGSVPGLGWLHPINALAIFGLLAWFAHAVWRGGRADDSGQPAMTTA